MITLSLYKHKYGKDVVMMPVEMFTVVSRETIMLKCNWFNIVNPKNVFNMGKIDSIEIKLENLNDWKLYAPKE